MKGSSASICASDLGEPVRGILLTAAGAASRTQLLEDPISGTIEVQLATSTVARARSDGFDYEPTANSILFFGDANLPAGTRFRVAYQRFRRLAN
ncbi:MAG: hypothetical protein HC923_04070 [Myxococcales bacterium]|nr:hypothetical protein [Myxococcales bacterium]